MSGEGDIDEVVVTSEPLHFGSTLDPAGHSCLGLDHRAVHFDWGLLLLLVSRETRAAGSELTIAQATSLISLCSAHSTPYSSSSTRCLG